MISAAPAATTNTLLPAFVLPDLPACTCHACLVYLQISSRLVLPFALRSYLLPPPAFTTAFPGLVQFSYTFSLHRVPHYRATMWPHLCIVCLPHLPTFCLHATTPCPFPTFPTAWFFLHPSWDSPSIPAAGLPCILLPRTPWFSFFFHHYTCGAVPPFPSPFSTTFSPNHYPALLPHPYLLWLVALFVPPPLIGDSSCCLHYLLPFASFLPSSFPYLYSS